MTIDPFSKTAQTPQPPQMEQTKSGLYVPANVVSKFHENDDVDHSKTSHHHTLGEGPSQAAAGDHDHKAYAQAIYTVGPFGTTPPGPTGGVAFEIEKAGLYRFEATVSCFSTVGGGATVALYIDGVNVSQPYFFFNTINEHTNFPRMLIFLEMAVGTHYIAVVVPGNSDNNDRFLADWFRVGSV
jgi:hypothetical protein